MLKYKINHKIKLFLEKIRGIELTKITTASELGLDPQKFFQSSSSGGRELRAVLLELDIKETDRILDIGSGKGGAIYTLHQFPFERIDGIEISKELVDIANDNIAKLNLKKTQIFCQNSNKFSQFGLYNFFYLYNPFDIQTLRETILRIIAQRQEFTLIYNNPTGHAMLVKLGLKCFRKRRGSFNCEIKLYKFSNKR